MTELRPIQIDFANAVPGEPDAAPTTNPDRFVNREF